MEALHIVLITYLVLYFTGNLAPNAPRMSRAQRRRQDEAIAYNLRLARIAFEAGSGANPPKPRPVKSMRFITIVVCLPIIVMAAGVAARSLGLIH